MMCPDSNIAKNYHCKRTKTTPIIQEMPCDISLMDTILKTKHFSISTDSSEKIPSGSNNEYLSFFLCWLRSGGGGGVYILRNNDKFPALLF